MGVVRGSDGWLRYSRRVLKSRRWQVLRHQILERDGWECTCGCGSRHRLEVDHILPVRTHPELAFAPSNLQVLAASCHTKKTRQECGHAPAYSSPARDAWEQAVAELATGNATA